MAKPLIATRSEVGHSARDQLNEIVFKSKVNGFMAKCKDLLDESVALADDASNTLSWIRLFNCLNEALDSILTEYAKSNIENEEDLCEQAEALFLAPVSPPVEVATKQSRDNRRYVCNPLSKRPGLRLRLRVRTLPARNNRYQIPEKGSAPDKKKKKPPCVPFQCRYCGEEFRRAHNLHHRRHIREHKKEWNLLHPFGVVCAICSQRCKRRYHLEVHLESHNVEKNFVCEICGYATNAGPNLLKHRKSHGPRIFKCSWENCSAVFKTTNCLQLHVRRCHTGSGGKYVCDVCNKDYKSASHLRRHLAVHTGERAFPCAICGRAFNVRSNLRGHMRSKHSVELPKLKVTMNISDETPLDVVRVPKKRVLFSTAFVSDAQLNEHVWCAICSKICKNKALLQVHFESHSTQKKFVCEICGYATNTRHSLLAHRESHGPRIFKCSWENCSGIFKTKNCLRMHVRRLHIDHGGKYVCGVCNKDCKAASYLRRHSSVHSGERPYPCAICGRGFKSRGSLRNHVLSLHSIELPKLKVVRNISDETPLEIVSVPKKQRRVLSSKRLASYRDPAKVYRCNWQNCVAAFVRDDQLWRHVREVHQMTQRRTCAVCGKQFRNASSLKEHVKAHTGEKPFACYVCGRLEPRLFTLQRHVTKAHKIEFDRSKYPKSEDSSHIDPTAYARCPSMRPTPCYICGKVLTRPSFMRNHVRRMHPTAERADEEFGSQNEVTPSSSPQRDPVLENIPGTSGYNSSNQIASVAPVSANDVPPGIYTGNEMPCDVTAFFAPGPAYPFIDYDYQPQIVQYGHP